MIGTAATLCACLPLFSGADDGSALGLTDLPAYQSALRADDSQPVARVTFRELWDHPDIYRGKRVQVEGKVILRFRQDAIGEFPALEESWALTGSDDLLCFVYPQVQGRKPPAARAKVLFTGTFLKLVRYPGGDVERLAPLIIGPNRPVLLAKSPSDVARPSDHWLDWTVGTVMAVVVVLALAFQHLKRPPTRRADELSAPPAFVEGDVDDEAQE